MGNWINGSGILLNIGKRGFPNILKPSSHTSNVKGINIGFKITKRNDTVWDSLQFQCNLGGE